MSQIGPIAAIAGSLLFLVWIFTMPLAERRRVTRRRKERARALEAARQRPAKP